MIPYAISQPRPLSHTDISSRHTHRGGRRLRGRLDLGRTCRRSHDRREATDAIHRSNDPAGRQRRIARGTVLGRGGCAPAGRAFVSDLHPRPADARHRPAGHGRTHLHHATGRQEGRAGIAAWPRSDRRTRIPPRALRASAGDVGSHARRGSPARAAGCGGAVILSFHQPRRRRVRRLSRNARRRRVGCPRRRPDLPGLSRRGCGHQGRRRDEGGVLRPPARAGSEHADLPLCTRSGG